MYLIDTNIFLEVLLSQEREESCKAFLDAHVGHLYVSDFSVHSIGIILFRSHKEEVFHKFTKDVLPRVDIVTLQKDLYEQLAELKQSCELDFDDLYQCQVAKDKGLQIVTMDRDFEKVTKDIEVVFLQEVT